LRFFSQNDGYHIFQKVEAAFSRQRKALTFMTKTFFAGVAGGLIGGLLGAYLFMHLGPGPNRSATAVATTRRQDVVSAGRIQLVDAGGRMRAELAISGDGGPALFFFDTAGRNRMVLGLYSAAEGEAPSVVLNDAQQRAAGIFRLFGPRDTPVVVLKNQGRDRSIFGLNPNSTDPFLVNYAGDGTKSGVFGNY
jgi:hypothetical protein